VVGRIRLWSGVDRPADGGAPISAYVIRLYIGAAAQALQFVVAPQTFVFMPQ